MPGTTYTLSGTFADLTGGASFTQGAAASLKGHVEAWGGLTSDDAATRLGSYRLSFDPGGSWTVTLPATGTGQGWTPEVQGHRIVLRYIDPGTGKPDGFTSDWFELTADTTFAEVVETIVADVQSAFTSAAAAATSATNAAASAAAAQTAETNAEAAQAAAEEARDEAETFRNQASEIALGDADAAMAGAVANPASDTHAALTDHIASIAFLRYRDIDVVRAHDADNTGATSAVAAADAAVAAAVAGGGRAAIQFPEGTYDLTAGLANAISAAHIYVMGEGEGKTTLRHKSGTLFNFTTSGGGLSHATITALTTPDAGARVADLQGAIGTKLHRLQLDNVRQLARLGTVGGASAHVISIRDIRGETDPSAGSIVIDVVKGAGLSVEDLDLSAKGVGYPLDNDDVHPANDTRLFRWGQDSWDTAQVRNVRGNRYNIGLDLDVQANKVVGNLWFDEFIADYCKTNGYHLKTGANANLRTITFHGGYAVGTDAHSVLVEALAGYMRHIKFLNVEARQAGKNNWRITGTTLQDLLMRDCFGLAGNRLDATNVGSEKDDLVILANGVTVRGGHYGEPGTGDWVPYNAAARYGANVGADLDTRITDATFSGTAGEAILNANTAASDSIMRKRLITNNRAADGSTMSYASTGPEAAPVSAAVQTHRAATVDTLHIFGGTVTNITLNGVQVASSTAGTVALTLRPGDTWSITYSVAPTVVRRVAA